MALVLIFFFSSAASACREKFPPDSITYIQLLISYYYIRYIIFIGRRAWLARVNEINVKDRMLRNSFSVLRYPWYRPTYNEKSKECFRYQISRKLPFSPLWDTHINHVNVIINIYSNKFYFRKETPTLSRSDTRLVPALLSFAQYTIRFPLWYLLVAVPTITNPAPILILLKSTRESKSFSLCVIFLVKSTLAASTAWKTRIKFFPANFSRSSLVHVGSPSLLSYKRSNRSGYFETSSKPSGILSSFN